MLVRRHLHRPSFQHTNTLKAPYKFSYMFAVYVHIIFHMYSRSGYVVYMKAMENVKNILVALY